MRSAYLDRQVLISSDSTLLGFFQLLQFFEGPRPVFAQQAGQRAVGQQFPAGLAASGSNWSHWPRSGSAESSCRSEGTVGRTCRAPPSPGGTPSPSPGTCRSPRRGAGPSIRSATSAVASRSRDASSSLSRDVSVTGLNCARCRISSEYALPIPLNSRGSVSARLSV